MLKRKARSYLILVPQNQNFLAIKEIKQNKIESPENIELASNSTKAIELFVNGKLDIN